jgi:Caspase domain
MIAKQSRALVLCLMSSGLYLGCGRKTESTADLKFRPYDHNAKNIFMVLGGINGLDGVPTDVREMTKVLQDKSNGFNWTVESNDDAPKDYILRELTANAAAVGENGTLGFYVTGHGTESGEFLTANGFLSYTEVAEAISKGRAQPLKRLLTFNDSCFSGNWVDGQGALPERFKSMAQPAEFFADPSNDEANALANRQAENIVEQISTVNKSMSGKAVEQFLTFAASKKTQTSLDYGSERGGAFTWSLRQTFGSLKQTNKDATMGDLAKLTAQKTWDETQHHLPVFKAVPESMLQEKLFEFATK